MIEYILVGAAVLWAAVYSAIKLVRFIKESGSKKSPKCSCSGCPYIKS